MPERLIGRRSELAAIESFLDAAGETPHAMLIEGEAGIGKTLLWQEGVGLADRRGHRVLIARPTGSEVRLSFAGLTDLLADVSSEVLPDLPSPQRRALEAALLLAEPDESADPRGVGLAVLGSLRALAERGPVLVAVDDLQWLDEPSGELLTFALRRLRDEPVRLLASIRTEAGGRVPFELDRALGEDRLRQLRLGPLSLGGLHELLRARLGLSMSRAVFDRVHESSRGNPFYALEIGRELIRRGSEPSTDQPLPVPDDRRALLRRRLARLSARSRALLLAAAALPRSTVGLLESVTDSPDEVAADVDEAVQAGIVELDGEQVRFIHPLLASVCLADASPRRRRAIHARLAQVVGDPEARARHLALAAEGTDEEVAGALEQAAARAAGRGALRAAAELWDLASKLTPPEHNLDGRRRALAAANAGLGAGDIAGARSLLDELAGQSPSGPDRADLLVLLSYTHWDDIPQAAALCKRALEEPGVDDRLRSRAHHNLGVIVTSGGDIRQGIEHARLAFEFAEQAGDEGLIAGTLAWLAWQEVWAGAMTPGLLKRAIELEDRFPPIPPYAAAATTALGCSLLYRGSLDEARATFEGRLSRATAAGDDFAASYLLCYLAEVECRAGRWARADRLAAQTIELFEQRGLEQHGTVALYYRAFVDAHFGRADQARAAAEQGLAIARATGLGLAELMNVGVLGFLELSLGDPEAAARHLRPLPDRLVELGYNEPNVPPVWSDAIEALVGVGEVDQARRYLALYEQRATGRPWAVATAARCRGMLAGAEGNQDAARAAFADALAQPDRGGPFEHARAVLALGSLERRTKQKRAAREALEAALAAFEELGARLWAARTRDELARIGGRPPTASTLTEAERRVAELVAEGRSNREVAAALFVSENTIESQLRSVYRKLGVRSRTQLAHRFPKLARDTTSGAPP